MAWNRKGVTYVVTPDPWYEVDGDLLIDLPVSGKPMDGFRFNDFVARRRDSENYGGLRGLDLPGDQDSARRLHGPSPLAGGAR